ncbi:MAG: PAS domain-containing protein [Myxococcales bacterium]|nr:PAS domain-containing protein [Myxococcales bacterium]
MRAWLASDGALAAWALDAPTGLFCVRAGDPTEHWSSPPLAAAVAGAAPLEVDLERLSSTGCPAEVIVRWRRGKELVSTSGELYSGTCPTDPSLRVARLAVFHASRLETFSSQQLGLLLESLPHFVWTCLPDGRCDYLSPQWVEYTGLPEAEQLGYAWLEQVHPDDRAPTQERWAEAAERGDVFDTEFRLRRHDGEHRWFKTRAIALYDAHGQLTKWIGSNTDVQDLRDAQARLGRANAELEAKVLERTSALAAAKRELELAQRIAHVGSWSMDLTTGAITWSDELRRTFGREPGSVVPSFEAQEAIFEPESWVRLRAAVEHAERTGEGYELEVAFRRPNGERRVVIARAETLASDGRIVRLVGTTHDVTELADAREQLSRALERVRLATEAAGMGVWDLDLPSATIVWDRRMHELYGVPEGTPIVHDTWFSALAEEDREPMAAAERAAVEHTGRFEQTFRIRHPEGMRVIRAVAQVAYDAEGRARRMTGVNWDVTREHATARDLERQRVLLEQFVRHAPAAIAMTDRDLRVLAASERFVADLTAGESWRGASLPEVAPALPVGWAYVRDRVLHGAVERCDEDLVVRGDRRGWVQWEARPWSAADERVGGMMFVTQDITERKELEILLQRNADELRRSNQDLEQFAYAASHDLQEPLRAVAGCAQLLSRGYRSQLDERGEMLLGHIVEGAERMRGLITDLLAYSRVSSRGSPLRDFALADSLERALANLATAITEAGAVVVVGALPAKVHGDEAQIALVLQNLVGNALKYRRAEGVRIEIDAEIGPTEVTVRVQDDGIGIEPRFHDRIFELFQRLHTRDEHPGSGIGLALCARIIRRHGGQLGVTSALGEGATFHFTLPKTSSLADDPS